MPVLRNISELATCPASPGQDEAGIVRNAALAWAGERIEWVGPEADMPLEYRREPVTDCQGRLARQGGRP